MVTLVALNSYILDQFRIRKIKCFISPLFRLCLYSFLYGSKVLTYVLLFLPVELLSLFFFGRAGLLVTNPLFLFV